MLCIYTCARDLPRRLNHTINNNFEKVSGSVKRLCYSDQAAIDS